MHNLNADNAVEYLRDSGRVGLEEQISVRELTGGVSNTVLLVMRKSAGDFVLKQALPQLRVSETWLADVRRVWREADVMRLCSGVLSEESAVGVPTLLWEDRSQYVLAMSAAPLDHVVWKSDLLAGRADQQIASSAGRLLGRLHAGTWCDESVAEQIGDRELFDQLRIDPYYRHVAERHTAYRQPLNDLIESLEANPCCLVHADYSPKNLLILPDGGLMAVDFECGHYGDGAFDLGFFLTHLVLKAIYHAPGHAPFVELTRRFCASYEEQLVPVAGRENYDALVTRSIGHLAGCMLARLDGKSPVEYLQETSLRSGVRQVCEAIFADHPKTWGAVLQLCDDELCRLGTPPPGN